MATSYVAKSVSLNSAFQTLASSTTVARETGSFSTTTNGNNVNDFRITVQATLAAGTPTGSKAVFVWVKASDDGTIWNGNATANDASLTLDSPHQFPLGCVIPFPTTTLTRAGSFSLKAACGGSLPNQFGIIILNSVGFAFTACAVKVEEEYNT
jgi:hypothetical protein